MFKKRNKLLLLISLLGAALPLLGLSSCGGSGQDSNAFEYCKQMNTFLEKCQSSGLDQYLLDKWMSLDGDKTVPFEKLDGKNGNLNVATCATLEPFSFISNNKYVGICMDYVYYFAKYYGYTVTIHDYSNTSAIIDAVASGKDVFAAGPTTITEERKQSVAFSNPYYTNQIINITLVENKDIYNTKESLAGKKVGTLAGSTGREYIREDIPTAEILEFPSLSDLNLALRKGSIQSYYSDSSTYDYMRLTEKDIIKTYATDENYYGFVFQKYGYQSVSELQNATIATLDGSAYDKFLDIKLPNAKRTYYKDLPSCSTALNSGKADAFVTDYAIGREMMKNLPNMYALQEAIGTSDVAAAFPKTASGEARKTAFNSFLGERMRDGTLRDLIKKWLNYEDIITETYIPYDTLPNINGVFKLSVDPTIVPFVFVKDNRLTGLEIELFYYFCKSAGYKLKIEQMNFEALIPSLATNDAAVGMILETEERKQSVDFSDSYYTSDVVLICKAGDVVEKSFWEKIGDSFYKTFVKEDRWKMFLYGIGNTLIICLSAVLGGIIIGTLLYMLCKDNNKVANIIAKIYNAVMHNIPVVVILMIFYYIVFAATDIGGIIVSIIVFSLTFSTSIFGMLQTSVNAIDKEQFDAAYALGYKRNQTFFKIIVPQASRMFYPHLSSDIVSLLKETAVVGYIAVMDLTKVSDIVRSRTYEAFFPLIATAIIYFLLAVILVQIVKLIQRKTDPRRRKKTTIKGVKMHD